ncbi:hypothetical protein F3Y22_tig00110184pilonHSYRG00005 [Hibiscus syriacus]|uniref:Uncharacterized protein n=1 Tax=Hibiscus syriacus TaxID=106335 RepID=A0A6A3BE09_HIBSY|nr:hypothetical protein F3Y22_tig00110184pilonHSYRG00005 [Hibiscus syriacus]
MASSTIVRPKQGKHLLKDFLLHDYHSSEFNSFPRKASKTISAFRAMIYIVKNIHFITAIKSPLILPRNLSRKLSKRNSQVEGETKMTTVRVKDILRWKSFRDSVDQESQPSGFASSSPDHHSTTTPSTSTACRSNGSSWCDSDFSSEYEVDAKDHMETKAEVAAANAANGHKYNYASEENEQHSPLSVLDYGQEEDDEEEDSFSSFNQSHAITQRIKHKHFQSVEKLEEDEERALQLLNHVKETSSLTSCDNIGSDKLVSDLFREELNETRDTEVENEMVTVTKAWINGDQSETAKWGYGDKRGAYAREMDREGRWSKFVEERQELAWEIECGCHWCQPQERSYFITVVLDIHQAIDTTARDRVLLIAMGDHFQALADSSTPVYKRVTSSATSDGSVVDNKTTSDELFAS